MNIGKKDRQTLFNLKLKQGKSEDKANKEITRDVNWLNKLEGKKKSLTREVRELEQRKINLKIVINKLLEKERKCQI